MKRMSDFRGKIRCLSGAQMLSGKPQMVVNPQPPTVPDPIPQAGSGVLLGGLNDQSTIVRGFPGASSRQRRLAIAPMSVPNVIQATDVPATQIGRGVLGDIKPKRISKKKRNNLVFKPPK